MRHSLFLCAIALIVLPGGVEGQVPADSLVQGDQVRYKLTGPFDNLPDECEGTFEALTITGVTLARLECVDAPPFVDLPAPLIKDFEVVRGRENWRWPGALVGGLASCAVLMAVDTGEDDIPIVRCPLGLFIGGFAGFAIGNAIVYDNWVDVDFN